MCRKTPLLVVSRSPAHFGNVSANISRSIRQLRAARNARCAASNKGKLMESRTWELILTRAQIRRWNVLQAKVSKFVGFFAQIERLDRSGKSTEDKVRDA